MQMTQEQKVRTREEQEAVLYLTMKSLEGGIPLSHDPDHLMKLASKHILEAEARGAAEERGKVEETPSAYVRPDDFYRDDGDERFGPWSSEQSGKCTIPLYTRPANAAALEARVRELEGALKEAISALGQVKDCERGGYRARNGKFVELQMSDGERADIIHSDVTTECEAAFESVRAVLKKGDPAWPTHGTATRS